MEEFKYPTANSSPWINACQAPADLKNVYGPRINGTDASDADQLTAAVLEGRRCHRALLDIVRKEAPPAPPPPRPDAIAYGTYPVDVHSPEGTMLRYMDGREEVIGKDGGVTWRRWRNESFSNPLYYQILYRCQAGIEKSASRLPN